MAETMLPPTIKCWASTVTSCNNDFNFASSTDLQIRKMIDNLTPLVHPVTCWSLNISYCQDKPLPVD